MRKLAFPMLLLAAMSLGLMAQSTSDASRRRIVEVARKYEGVPYVYGAESPEAFDCSGFVRYVYREAAGITLPRNSRAQFAAGEAVKTDAIRPGDVLVFDTVGGAPSHVAIYLGGDSMIHAASAGPRTGVIVSSLEDRYFRPKYIGARSFIAEELASRGDLAMNQNLSPAPPPPPGPGPGPKPSPSSPAEGRPQPKSPGPEGLAPGPVIAQIGFTLKDRPVRYADQIPALTGTALAFTITNGTGKDGRFVLIFYKADKDFSRAVEIHRELSAIRAGAAVEIPPYAFTEAGIYKLIVKDNWNAQLMERVFRVVEKGS